VAILDGDLGETEGKIFATIATAFVAGSTAVAGLACLARGGTSRLLGAAGIVLACAGFGLWTAQVWAEWDSEGYWKLLGVVTAWTLAVLAVTTNRLLTSAPRLLRTLYPATAAAAFGAALVATVMVLREVGDGWQVFAVLLVLTLLGEALAPILDRYLASDERAAERILGVVAGAEVVAVHGSRDTVRVGDRLEPLRSGESVVIRAR
jgi:hypothetical protein